MGSKKSSNDKQTKLEFLKYLQNETKIKKQIEVRNPFAYKSPKNLFRKYARIVLTHVRWMKYDLLSHDELIEKEELEKPLLSFFDKILLITPPSARSKHLIQALAEKFLDHKIFQGFPNDILIEIFRQMEITCYQAGRIILKRGHKRHAMYILIEGEILVEEMIENSIYDETIFVKNQYIQPGIQFGDVDLYFNETGSDTYKCGPHGVTLLVLPAEYYHRYYSPFKMDKYWKKLKHALNVCSEYFGEFSKDGIKDIFLKCSFEILPPDETLTIEKGDGVSPDVLFIIRGEIQVVQKLLVQNLKKMEKYSLSRQYKYYPDQNRKNPLPLNILPVFLNTVRLTRGAALNLGEILSNYPMYTLTEVKLMKLPLSILQKYLNEATINKFITNINDASPTARQMFESFIDTLEWEEYKYKQTVFSAKRDFTTIHHLPLTLRAKHVHLSSSVLKQIKSDPSYLLGENISKYFSL